MANEQDSEMRVFRPQQLRIISSDADGLNRVGGGDQDLFTPAFWEGPTSNPTVGISGGNSISFKDANCYSQSTDSTCAYYEINYSFDFAGTFRIDVWSFDNLTFTLIPVNKGDLAFDIKGLGELTEPVPANRPSSIDWASEANDRSKLSNYDLGLSQTVCFSLLIREISFLFFSR